MTLSNAFRHSSAGLAVALLLAACGGGGDAPAEPTSNFTDAADVPARAADVAPLPDAVDTGGTSAAAAQGDLAQEGAGDAAGAPADLPGRDATVLAVSAGSTCGLPDFQAAALARINQYRATGASCRTAGTFGPAQPLRWNAQLLQAASGHSRDMATRNYFSHTSLDGRTMVQRINATGYLWSALGENIAAGQTSVNGVVDAWMKSDGHCRNIMNPNLRDVGMACVSSTTSRYRTYWTMDLGRPR
jgi:uncharacterized protein YkwD